MKPTIEEINVHRLRFGRNNIVYINKSKTSKGIENIKSADNSPEAYFIDLENWKEIAINETNNRRD